MVVWESIGQDGDDGGVYQQRYNAHGQAAGTETLVNSATTGEQGEPSVAALDDGSWVVSWYSPDGDGAGVYQRHYAPDRTGTAGGETLIGTNWSETIAGPFTTFPQLVDRAAHSVESALVPTTKAARTEDSFPSAEVARSLVPWL